MEIQPVQVKTISPTTQAGTTRVSLDQSAYQSSIRTLKEKPKKFGEAIISVIQTAGMLAILPAFIYTFFVAGVSLLYMPVAFVMIPIVLMGDTIPELLHTVLPWIFSKPE